MADATDAQKETLHFKWDFNDPGTFNRLDPNRAAGRDSGTEYGFLVAHTYDAGTFNATLTVTDGSVVQVINVPAFTIDSAASRFPGANTIVVDPTGSYPNKPSGAQQALTPAAAFTALEANNGGRVLFYTGHTHLLPNHLEINGQNLAGETAVNEVLLGAIGSGPRPIIDSNFKSFSTWKINNSQSQIVVAGLDFIGGYDSSTGSGTPLWPCSIPSKFGSWYIPYA